MPCVADVLFSLLGFRKDGEIFLILPQTRIKKPDMIMTSQGIGLLLLLEELVQEKVVTAYV
jgi:hypothetical protein